MTDDINYPYESEKYKMTLALDLIIYLSAVLTTNMDKAKASNYLGQIMDLWNRRVEGHIIEINKVQVEKLKAMSALSEDPDDVLDIIVQAHQTLPSILRDEFVGTILENMQKQVIERIKE